jgi:hypothetical protein
MVIGVLLAAVPLAGAGDPPPKVRPVILWVGTDSGCKEPSVACCRSVDEWCRTWNAHQDGGGDDGRDRPVIDFETHMVLAVFQGEGGRDGGLRMFEVLDEAEGLKVRYFSAGIQTVFVPGAEIPTKPRTQRNYVFAVVPRSDKAVTFERGQRHRLDEPPGDWKQEGAAPAVRR